MGQHTQTRSGIRNTVGSWGSGLDGSSSPVKQSAISMGTSSTTESKTWNSGQATTPDNGLSIKSSGRDALSFSDILSRRVMWRWLQARTFTINEGDPVLYGKFLNKPGVVRGFGKNEKGDPTVIIEPGKGGQEKEVKLFKVRYDETRAQVQEAVERLAYRYRQATTVSKCRYTEEARPDAPKCPLSDEIWVKVLSRRLGEMGPRTVWLVHGDIVRDEVDIDFSVSGDEQVLVLQPAGVVESLCLRDLEHRPGQRVLALSKDKLTYSWSPLKAVIKHRAQEGLVEVTTRQGRSMRVSVSHSCLTVDDAGDVVKIRPSDMVPGQTLLPVCGNVPATGMTHWCVQDVAPASKRGRALPDLPLDRDLGFFIGLYLAEGNADKAIHLAITTPELRIRILRYCQSLGLNAPWSADPTTLCVGNRHLTRAVLRDFGTGSATKWMPGWVQTAPIAFREGLLDGFWSGDGSVLLSRGRVEAYAQVDSEGLARGVQHLLTGLGLVSTFTTFRRRSDRFPDANEVHYRIRVASSSVGRLPPLTHPDKDRARSVWRPPAWEMVAVAPVPSHLIVNGRSGQGMLRAKSRKANGHAGLLYVRRSAEHPRLKQLVGADVLWDVVESVEPVDPEEWIYDLKVDVDHTFVLGSGLTVHNTNGGNPAVYGYVPDDEVWVEDFQGPRRVKDLACTLLHEMVEMTLMRRGWAYKEAHAYASRMEEAHREQDWAASEKDILPLVAQWFTPWVQGLKQATPRRKLANPALLHEYPARLKELREEVANAKRLDVENSPNLWVAWYMFYKVGKEWAAYVIDHLALPPKAAKAIEMAVRLFSKNYPRGKSPPSITKWFEANEARLTLLDQARTWSERSAESGIFQVGPFTVHDTIQASVKDLDNAKNIIERAVKAVQSSGIPGFNQMAHGQLFLVGQLGRRNWTAWYMPTKDMIYLRPGVRGSSNEESARHLVHELGHRFWAKKLDRGVKGEWVAHHTLMTIRRPDRRLPEVGEVLATIVNNKRVRVDSYKKEGRPGQAVLVEVETGAPVGAVPITRLMEWVQEADHRGQFPSLYAATDAEEHFCEALSLYAFGRLTSPNLDAFEKIVLGVAPRSVARLAAKYKDKKTVKTEDGDDAVVRVQRAAGPESQSGEG